MSADAQFVLGSFLDVVVRFAVLFHLDFIINRVTLTISAISRLNLLGLRKWA
jgi:hypothetical protein